ncbi:hypothetical protein ES703_27278 [subsurface metagenome]
MLKIYKMTAEELKDKIETENLSADLVAEIGKAVAENGDDPDGPLSNAIRAYLWDYCTSMEDYGDVDFDLMAAVFADGWVMGKAISG